MAYCRIPAECSPFHYCARLALVRRFYYTVGLWEFGGCGCVVQRSRHPIVSSVYHGIDVVELGLDTEVPGK